ncbi:MAG TPA: sulfotransferase [Caulobacteraceae bacterium]|nr:sulfotransferase [Caulobacteraceae bacterium]
MNQTTPPVSYNTAQAQQVLAEVDRALETDLSQAITLAQAALERGIEHPKLLTLVAFQFEEEGRYPEAMRLLDRAAGLDPKDVMVWNSVGLCLVKQDKRRAAVSAFEHALALNPSYAQAYNNLGMALEYLGDYEGAREQFSQAVRLFPDYADPLAGLASLAVRNGDWPAARDFASRALALQPFQAAAMSALAQADMNEKDFKAAERALRELASHPALDRFDKPAIHCLLGDALDGQGRPDEAFAEYLAGKAGFRALHRAHYEDSGLESQLGMTERLIAYFEATPDQPWSEPAPLAAGETSPARAHAFLLGFARSGTTLLENVLASHADVLAIDERTTLRDIEPRYLPNAGTMDHLGKLPADEAAQQRETYWKLIRSFNMEPDSKVVVDKMPLYTAMLPIVTKLFPGVKVLFALRDPRDVVLSCFRRSFQINAGMYQFVTLEGAARYYDAVMRLAELYKRKLPLDLHVVRYESFVADFEGEARAVCDFLGIDWSEDLRNFAENARTRQIRTPSAAQVRGGLYSTGAGQWRRYARHLEPILPILAPWVERFGYDPD